MLVSDIIDDVKQIYGSCSNDELYRRLTDAVHMLSNKGKWDGMIGMMDICVFNQSITLPRDVMTPLKINIDGVPSVPRDKWFEYHLNGPGSQQIAWKNWREIGRFPTYRDLTEPSGITVEPTSSGDENKTITIFGYDEEYIEAREDVSISFTSPVTSQTVWSSITAVIKPKTVGKVKLYASEASTGNGYTVAFYGPTETEPRYIRIEVPENADTIRMQYRRANRDLTGPDDYIPLASRLAVLEAARAVKYMFQDNAAQYEASSQRAYQLLKEDEGAKLVTSPTGPQIVDRSSWVTYQRRRR